MKITSKDFEGYFEDDETKKLSDEVLKIFKGTNFETIKIKVLKNNENYYQINHFISNFDISDMEFHEIMGTAILEVFYKKGIINTGQTNLIEEKAEYLFENELSIGKVVKK